jgi:Tetratricopeptide repeat
VTDFLGKLIKLLDQILPFLQNSPAWLRIWIYTLIFLNCLTVAGVCVSYLIARQSHADMGSLRYFSVDQPVNNQQISLGENLLLGKFPIVEAGPKLERSITVKVFKSPGHEPVPQDGEPSISTVDGAWRYEWARFPDESPYEIRITASLGDNSTFQVVTVSCRTREAAWRDSVEQERKLRGVARPASPDRTVSVEEVMNRVAAFQNQFYKAYLADRDLNAAQQIVSQALDVIQPALIASPDSHDLQNARAYFLKDYGMILRDLSRNEEAQHYFEEAGKMFAAVVEQDRKDPSAWNGLGSVYLLRGDPQNALQFINKALELQPGYEEALHDRKVAQDLLQAQQKANVR